MRDPITGYDNIVERREAEVCVFERHVDSTGASNLARPMREASHEPNDRSLRMEPPFFFAVRRGPMPMAIGHVVR